VTKQTISPETLDDLLKDARDPAQFETMFKSLKKALISEDGPVPVEVPRDQDCTFERELIKKGDDGSKALTRK